MNKLLIDDHPIQVLPKLAVEIGLNEAIFVQQLHYWINGRSGKFIQGKKWVYNTYKDWEEQFPFWSNATVRRVINSCEKQEMIITSSAYNRAGFDKTKWYTVNYEHINRLSNSIAQNEQRACSKRATAFAQNEQPNTIDYQETTTETTNKTYSPAEAEPRIPYKEIVDHLNKAVGSQYRHTTSKTQALIKARFKEGFDLEDFKQVVEIKAKQWKNDKEMAKYLRPETLFGTKFEGYLNESAAMPRETRIYEHQVTQEDIDEFNRLKAEGY